MSEITTHKKTLDYWNKWLDQEESLSIQQFQYLRLLHRLKQEPGRSFDDSMDAGLRDLEVSDFEPDWNQYKQTKTLPLWRMVSYLVGLNPETVHLIWRNAYYPDMSFIEYINFCEPKFKEKVLILIGAVTAQELHADKAKGTPIHESMIHGQDFVLWATKKGWHIPAIMREIETTRTQDACGQRPTDPDDSPRTEIQETPEERRKMLLGWAKEELSTNKKRGIFSRLAKREGVSRQAVTKILASFRAGQEFLKTLSHA
ncbi:MAG: hypothetical protein H7838_08735 [Magnetococcus sp. DMHC-8]